MPNIYVKPTVVARAALGLLQREIILPNLVWRAAEADFAGKIGDTVNVRIPSAPVASRKFDRTGVAGDATVQMDNVAQSSFPVKLTDHLYNAVPVTDEELTMQTDDFAAQIVAPQIRGIAEGAEQMIADVLDARAADATLDAVKPEDTLTDLAIALDQNNVPRSGRVLVIAPDLQGPFLNSDNLKDVSASNMSEVLREATLGTLRGFRIVVSNALKPGSGHAFVREAIAYVTKAPAKPQGAAYAASQTYQGLAMRWLMDYDVSTLEDRSVVGAYAGVTLTGTSLDGAGRILTIQGAAS